MITHTASFLGFIYGKIIATNDTLRQIIIEEIDRLGVDANLNHIDTSQVTDMSAVFANLHFYGDISKWIYHPDVDKNELGIEVEQEMIM